VISILFSSSRPNRSSSCPRYMFWNDVEVCRTGPGPGRRLAIPSRGPHLGAFGRWPACPSRASPLRSAARSPKIVLISVELAGTVVPDEGRSPFPGTTSKLDVPGGAWTAPKLLEIPRRLSSQPSSCAYSVGLAGPYNVGHHRRAAASPYLMPYLVQSAAKCPGGRSGQP